MASRARLPARAQSLLRRSGECSGRKCERSSVRARALAAGAPAPKETSVPEATFSEDADGFSTLCDTTVSNLRRRGITALFPLQTEVAQRLRAGLDVFCRARTGTGKTLAFVLPIGERLIADSHPSQRGRPPKTLIMAPTRELARQVEREFSETYPSLSLLCAYGGTPIAEQTKRLHSGIDGIIGTPGRLIDLVDRGDLSLASVNTVVIDEGDEMLSAGFQEDTDRLLSECPEQRQTTLFSATMPKWVKELLRTKLSNPHIIDQVGEKQQRLAHGVETLAISVPEEAKVNVAADVLTVHSQKKAIVFAERKASCDAIAAQIDSRLPSEALHGDMSQSVREKTLSRLRKGETKVLVATDVAARGLDISDVDVVLHLSVTRDPEAYTHRSGRTGRAGGSGKSIALVSPRERHVISELEYKTGAKMHFISPPGPEDVADASARRAGETLRLVSENVLPHFTERAQELMETSADPAQELARALAALSGCRELPSHRSLLTGGEGLRTIAVERDPSAQRGPPLDSKGSVLGQIAKALNEEGSVVGRIEMLSSGVGAVVDLPSEHAETLLQHGRNGVVLFNQVDKVPALQSNAFGDKGQPRGSGKQQRAGGKYDKSPPSGNWKARQGRNHDGYRQRRPQ